MINVEKMSKYITNESESSVISLKISPIEKMDCVCFIIYDSDKLCFLYGIHGPQEYVDFAREVVPAVTNFECLENSKEFIQSYRTRFLKKIEIEDTATMKLVNVACNADWSETKRDIQGFDGFSLFAHNHKTNQNSDFWCIYHTDANTPIANLANCFLDIINVDSHYRFNKKLN